MKVYPTDIPDVQIIEVDRFEDPRGFFSEVYNQCRFHQAGINITFVQDNHSLSRDRGTIRGLHYQTAPHAQHKLVRVIRGSILDVAVDIRRDSPTFGQHVSVVLDAESPRQLLVPLGFAHGFCTLEPNTEVLYKVSAFYAPEHDRGIRWDDPALGIHWPVSPSEALLSERDRKHPLLAEAKDLF